MKNIYIQTLKLGFENPEGITFNEVVKKLNIDLSKDKGLRLNYTKWFYDNFYNFLAEPFVIGDKTKQEHNLRISPETIEKFETFNQIRSHIKGDAVNKYIDYLELERTRKSSKQASYFATGSIFIAILAVLFPYLINPETIGINGKVNLVSIVLSLLVFGYSFFMMSNAEPDKKSTKQTFWSFSIIIVILSTVLSFVAVRLLNAILLNPSFFVYGFAVLPVVIYATGHISRKYKETFSSST